MGGPWALEGVSGGVASAEARETSPPAVVYVGEGFAQVEGGSEASVLSPLRGPAGEEGPSGHPPVEGISADQNGVLDEHRGVRNTNNKIHAGSCAYSAGEPLCS